jgi:hypothetical protein
MATLNNLENANSQQAGAGAIDLLIGIAGAVRDEDLRPRSIECLESLAAGMSGLRVAVAYPVVSAAEANGGSSGETGAPKFLTYGLSDAAPSLPWLANPEAYRAISRLAQKTGARASVILSADLAALDHASIAGLAEPLLEGSTLSVPIYPTAKYDGLLNSGLLYPFIRALYGKHVRFPLPVDFGIAGGMVARLAADGSRHQASICWPAVEGLISDASTAQVYVDIHHAVHTEGIDLSSVLGTLGSGLFEGAEKNASIWQRLRASQATPIFGTPPAAAIESEPVDVRPLIESFNLGLRNLQEVWSLVLPPITLLELKKLSRLPAEQFRLPDLVWAKIVYDFALAYRLRTISRTHLLGALTPLYLAWVASYAAEVRNADADTVESRIELLAAAFEEAKPYFVSRWRWPDRFNP